jgi:hypothetical protein
VVTVGLLETTELEELLLITELLARLELVLLELLELANKLELTDPLWLLELEREDLELETELEANKELLLEAS